MTSAVQFHAGMTCLLARIVRTRRQLLSDSCLLLVFASCRLWVTAEPHPQFPIGLLQMGIKITNEAPVGMKAGLRASYQWVNQDMLDAVGR